MIKQRLRTELISIIAALTISFFCSEKSLAESQISRKTITQLGKNLLANAAQDIKEWSDGHLIVNVSEYWFENSSHTWINDSYYQLFNKPAPRPDPKALPTPMPVEDMLELLEDSNRLEMKFKTTVQRDLSQDNFYDHYNTLLLEADELHCSHVLSASINPRECNDLSNYGFGILTLLLDLNQVGLAETKIPIEKIIISTFHILENIRLDTPSRFTLYLLKFNFLHDILSLYHLGYYFNELSKQFVNYTDQLEKDTLANINHPSRVNTLATLFKLNSFLLQFINQQTAFDAEIAKNAAARMISSKERLAINLRAQKSYYQYPILDFYNELGPLTKYYENRGNYREMDELTVFRGNLRAHYKELTPSIFERSLLLFWGSLSEFGTSITSMTITLLAIFSLILIEVFLSNLEIQKSNRKSIWINFFLVCTLRGRESCLASSPRLTLFLEAAMAIYLPIYMGFLITFLVRYR